LSPTTGITDADEAEWSADQRAKNVKGTAVAWLRKKYPGVPESAWNEEDWKTAMARAEAWERILRGESTMEEEHLKADQETIEMTTKEIRKRIK
jgi:hypothetical protein